MANSQDRDRDSNPDPITGAPGSHPVGTGIGAAGAGATGAAIGGAIGGPVGGAVGAVIGALAGGLAGKGVAEAIDPTAEDAYWRDNYKNEPYVAGNRSYEDYEPAYHTGVEGFSQHGPSTRFEDAEDRLREAYERRARDRGGLSSSAGPATAGAMGGTSSTGTGTAAAGLESGGSAGAGMSGTGTSSLGTGTGSAGSSAIGMSPSNSGLAGSGTSGGLSSSGSAGATGGSSSLTTGSNALSWDEAKPAVRAAWARIERRYTSGGGNAGDQNAGSGTGSVGMQNAGSQGQPLRGDI